MPKTSTRKRKARKADEFGKKKLKVGQKADPFNKTVIDLSSKRVIVPTQSITNTGSEANKNPSEESISSLKSALAHTRHYSLQTRRDAVKSVCKLVASYPSIIRPRLGIILEACCRLMLDQDPETRRSLLSVFHGLADITGVDTASGSAAHGGSSDAALSGEKEWAPFIPLVMAFTSSALSHLNADVRASGLAFLEFFTAKFPRVLQTYTVRVIPDVVALLSGTRGRANAAKTAGSGTCLQVNPNSRFGSTIGSRLKILNTLKIVVKLAYPKLNDEAVAAAQDIKFSLDFLDTGSSSKQPLAALESPDSLASTLSPILMDLWSESLPEAVFNGKNVVVNDSLRVCRAVLVLLRTLLALPDVTKETEILILEGFRAHVAPHFPFFAAVQASSSKPQRQRVGEVETVEAVLGEMDVSAALIYARFPDSRTSDGARIQEFLDDLLDSRAVPFIFPNSWIQGMRPGREKLELICMSRPFFWTVILSNGPGSEFIMERLVALFNALDVDALCMNQQIAKYVLFEFLSGLFDKVYLNSEPPMCLNQWFLDALPVFYGQVKHGVSDTLVRNDIHDSLLEFQIKILKREYKIEFPAPRLEKCTSLLLEHGATRMESLRKCLCLSYHLPAPWSDTLIDVLLSPKVCGALTKFGLDLFLLDLVNQRQDTLNLCLDSAVYLDVMINVGLVVLPGRFPRAKSDLLRAVVGKWDVSVAEAVWAHLSDSLTALLEKPSASAELLYMIIRLVC
ncbi:MAG: hypothetical protein SGCHY_005190, partial [Lobulomycetales sp.]